MTTDPWLADWSVDFRRAWLTPLSTWITEAWKLDRRPTRLLDYGCGDFQLAHLLPASAVVDGFDVTAQAREAARSRLVAGRLGGTVFGSPTEIPRGVYDGVILASVVQYLPSPKHFSSLLRELAGVLRPDSNGILVSDVPGSDHSRLADVVETARFARREMGPVGTLNWLARSAHRSPHSLTRFSCAEVLGAGEAVGLEGVSLKSNLSPFERRQTYWFRRSHELR